MVESRAALLVGVDGGFVAGLPHGASPSDQILRDLDALNAVEKLEDGAVPLAVWLKNATTLAGVRSEGVVFRRVLGHCGQIAGTTKTITSYDLTAGAEAKPFELNHGVNQQDGCGPFVSDSKPAQPRLKSGERVALIRQYAHKRWDPSDLPDAFWDEPECPPFIPPVGVFKSWMGEIYLKDGQPYGRWIGQSSGWMPEGNGAPSYVEETQRDAIIPGWFDDRLPPGFADNNLNYETAKRAWESEWKRRRR